MIKVTSMVEAHFFLVRPGMFGLQMGAQRSQNSTDWTVRAKPGHGQPGPTTRPEKPGPGQVGLDIQARLGLCFAARKIIRAGLELQFFCISGRAFGLRAGLARARTKKQHSGRAFGLRAWFWAGLGLENREYFRLRAGLGLEKWRSGFYKPGPKPGPARRLPGFSTGCPKSISYMGSNVVVRTIRHVISNTRSQHNTKPHTMRHPSLMSDPLSFQLSFPP